MGQGEKEKQAEAQTKRLKEGGFYQRPSDVRAKRDEALASNDTRTIMSAYNELADTGQLNKDDRKKLQNSRMWRRMSQEERIAFGENLENRMMEKTGRRYPISPLRYDQETNTYNAADDFEETRRNAAGAKREKLNQMASDNGFATIFDERAIPACADKSLLNELAVCEEGCFSICHKCEKCY